RSKRVLRQRVQCFPEDPLTSLRSVRGSLQGLPKRCPEEWFMPSGTHPKRAERSVTGQAHVSRSLRSLRLCVRFIFPLLFVGEPLLNERRPVCFDPILAEGIDAIV